MRFPILSSRIPIPMLMLAPEKEGGGSDQMERDAGQGALESGHFTEENTSSEEEVPPNFDELIGAEPAPREDKPPAPAAKAPAATPEPKPATPPPATVPDKGDHPSDPKRYADGTFKPKPGEEEPFPDIEPLKPKVPEPKPEVKTPEVKTPEVKPVEKAPEVKPADKVPEAKAPVKLPDDDKDLDAMEPKPTASEKTKNDFKILKDNVRSAREVARAAQKEAEELRAKTASTELPEDIKKQLETAKEDREFRQMFELENEPKGRAAYSAKLDGLEAGIVEKLMKDERLKLPESKAKALKEVGFDSKEGRQMVSGWIRQIRTPSGNPNDPKTYYPGDELLAEEVRGWFMDRQKVVQDRATEITQMRSNRDEYLQKRNQHEAGEFNRWGGEADKHLVNLSKGHNWTQYMEEPAGATPEQKAVVEAHNARVKDTIVPEFNKAVLDCFKRSPNETVEHVFNSMKLKHEVLPAMEAMKTENDTLKKRIEELEASSNGVRRITTLSQADGAPANPVKPSVSGIEGSKEASAEDALDAFLEDNNIKKRPS